MPVRTRRPWNSDARTAGGPALVAGYLTILTAAAVLMSGGQAKL